MVEFGTYYPQYNVSFTAGDVFHVSLESGVVKYKKNGVVYHTSPSIVTYPLKVDTALYTVNSTLTNAVVGGNWSGGSSGGGGSSSSEVLRLVADHLGTPRMILDQTGALANIKRHDYLPFGEELFAGTGGRTTEQGYTASDNVRQKFTSQERDTETGLDYFKARYYSPAQGRFTSVDPSRKSIIKAKSQTWNRYSYTYNNPLVMVDQNGKWPTKRHEKIVETAFNILSREKISQIQKGSANVDANWSKPARLLTENTLIEGQAFKHAMTPGALVRKFGGDVGRAQQEATRLMNDYISTTLGNAPKTYQAGENRNGVNNAALVTFGEAMHPVMDNMSPAHQGMQVYDLQPYLQTYQGWANIGLAPTGAIAALDDYNDDMAAHTATEDRDPTQDEMNTMIDQMRMHYLQTFGREEYERAVSREQREATDRRLGRQRQ